MPANTEDRRSRCRRQAVLGAAVFGLLMLACGALCAALCFIPGLPRWAVLLFAVLTAFCAALMIPALMVLRQRLNEIEGGELDEALKY